MTNTKKFNWYQVYLDGKLIDSVQYLEGISCEEVRRSLINHDGYSGDIKVYLRMY